MRSFHFTGTSVPERIGFWVVGWILLCLLWFLFVGVVSWPEILAGMGSAGLGALVWEALRAGGVLRYPPRLRWLRGLWRLPGRAIHNTVLILSALVLHVTGRRRIQGAFVEIPFAAVGDDDADGVTRAYLTAAMSFSPNTFVIGVDRKRRTMVVHQLVPQAPERVTADLTRL